MINAGSETRVERITFKIKESDGHYICSGNMNSLGRAKSSGSWKSSFPKQEAGQGKQNK
jgi:hypothetical protein